MQNIAAFGLSTADDSTRVAVGTVAVTDSR